MYSYHSPSNNAFTLLEVTISLVLISILTGIAINFLWPFNKNISDTINEIINAKTEAKSLAIFNGEQLDLIFYPQKIIISNHEKVYKEHLLSHDFNIVKVNDKSLINGFYTLSVNKIGLSEECLIKVQNDNTYKIIYLPTIGKPLILDEDIDFAKIHKEYL